MKSLFKLFFKSNKQNARDKQSFSASHQVKTKNKWLYPEDNFGTLKRGVE
jgi:hypothetical protein